MTRRSERVAEAIRRLASEIIRDELKDPRIKEMITVTKVEITPDLRYAKIYYSVLGDDKKRELVARGLKSAKSYIRRRIADELKLRYAPDIALRVDERIEHSKRVDKILDILHKEVEDERNEKGSRGA